MGYIKSESLVGRGGSHLHGVGGGSVILRPFLCEFIGNTQSGAREISDAEIFHVLNSDFVVSIHVQSREEGVNVLFLWVELRIQYSVGISQHWHSLKIE